MDKSMWTFLNLVMFFHDLDSLAKGNLDVAAHNDVFDDNYVLATFWQRFGEGPFLFQHAPIHTKPGP